jgi:uncharacterized protein (UPF0332 family)
LSLHHDLIEQAFHLAVREPKKPRQASLRRAISTAYYSLFHLLREDATKKFFPNAPANLRAKAGRAISHGEAKSVCEIFAKSGIKDLTTSPIETDLADVASKFNELQEARHKADYDLTETFDRVQALGHIQRAKDAIAAWARVRHFPNANVFLAALFLHSKWNKFN